MSTTQSSTHAKWPEIKGDIIKSWGKVSEVDLENTKGDFKQISTLLQKNYGETDSSYSPKLSEIFKRFEVKKDAATPPAVAAATPATDTKKQ